MNNNELEILAKLIIPALFLIAWALNQVLNKEAQQPPAGPLPRRPPGGLPPAPMPGQRPAPREVIWQESPPPPPRREPMAGPDEIIILGSETKPLRPSPAVPVRRRRSRSAPPAPPKPEPPRPAISAARPPAPPPPPPIAVLVFPSLAKVREALSSPARLREAILLREIFDKPLALRGRDASQPRG
jgi:hypothetical protein